MDTSSGNKGYSSSIAAFSIGIIAVIAAVIYSLVTKGSVLVIICEAVVLISLIVLLIISLKSKAKISEQMLKEELSPYASVNKNEIYQLFDMIEDAKSRRDISDAFAAGGSQKAEPEKKEEEAADDSMLIIFPDAEDEDAPANPEKTYKNTSDDSENKIEKVEAAEKAEKNDTVETKNGKPFGRRASDKLADPNDKTSNTGKDGNTMGEYDYDGRAGGRRRTDVDPNARSRDPYGRRRQGYDPYYDDVYYNEYGEPVRRRRPPAYDPYYSDVYYNEYGEPVRRRPAQPDPYARGGDVYYNEYGEPVRRRRPPVDAYGRPVQQQQRRRPAEDPRRRYDAAEGADPRRRRPVDGAPTPADDVQPKAAAPIEGAAPAPVPAETPAPQAEAPAQPVRPDNYYDDDYVPIVLPSDDPMEDDYYEQAPARRSAAGVRRYDNEAPTAPTRSRDRNRYQDDDDVDYDPVPVVVPVFDDEDDYAPPARGRDYDDPQGGSASRGSSRAVDDEDDDGYIPVSIPVDENDDPLPTDADIPRMPVPKKNISKVKIGKIRRKKIVRNSRKYKKFRASVHSLDDYLHNFSNKSKGL